MVPLCTSGLVSHRPDQFTRQPLIDVPIISAGCNYIARLLTVMTVHAFVNFGTVVDNIPLWKNPPCLNRPILFNTYKSSYKSQAFYRLTDDSSPPNEGNKKKGWARNISFVSQEYSKTVKTNRVRMRSIVMAALPGMDTSG